MYQALYRKYRPKNLDDVAGQKVIVKTFINAIRTNRISHAYLFSGPRGTGKTSISKIIAKTLNCTNLNDYIPCEACDNCISIQNNENIDIVEIDAASNNGVDEIRELKNNIGLLPSHSKYKIYIIDEIHMLTISAFNALLKTLEEPPDYVVFILATTEIHKVPETILSRCQKFEFKKISVTDIIDRIKYIVDKEKILIDDNVIQYIAKYSNGGLRDAIGLLDQLSSYKNEHITINDAYEVCGDIQKEEINDFLNEILNGKLLKSIEQVENWNNNGKNLSTILCSAIEMLKDALIYLNDKSYLTDKQNEDLNKFASVEVDIIYSTIDIFNQCLVDLKYENNKKLLVTLSLIKINSIIKQNIKGNSKENYDNNIMLKSNDNTLPDAIVKDTKNSFEQRKKVRINNVLAQFNKKDYLKFKDSLDDISSQLANPKYSSYVSLILDGELKAKGGEYLLFVYRDPKISLYFNTKVKNIEQLLFEHYQTVYKIVAVNENEWQEIKKNFNECLKTGKNTYRLIKDDEYDIDKHKSKINDIDILFNEIVEYK